MKEVLLVSSCLGGNNCKYNGGNNYNPLIEKIKEKYQVIFFCPETLGKLPIPRVPSEINGCLVMSKDGDSVTMEYNLGAAISLSLLKKYNCKKALLKEKSPSCGVHYIYDGTFTGKLIKGSGITATLFKENGVTLYSEEEIDQLL